MPWAKPHTDPEESEWLARRFYAHYLINQDFVLGIFAPGEQRLLGGTGYHLRGKSLDENTSKIGMWIRGDAAGQGLGTAVLRALLKWGFTKWPWQRIEWHCDADNTASARCAEKAGMKLEAHLRSYRVDHHGNRCDKLIFGMLRDERPAAQ
jgi:RimJ/RimL family protein N-acetyltransferase